MEQFRLVGASVAAFTIFVAATTYLHHARRLPPGPRGLPLIANMFDMPTEYQWLTFTEWAKKFGAL